MIPAHYLQLMGIDIWRQYGKIGGCYKGSYDRYVLYHSPSSEVMGTLFIQNVPILEPHVHALYRLLDAMLAAVDLKCIPRPVSSLVEGRLVVVMGEALAQAIVGISEPLDALRAQNIYSVSETIRLLVTYHPYEVFKNSILKSKVWVDLKHLKRFLPEKTAQNN